MRRFVYEVFQQPAVLLQFVHYAILLHRSSFSNFCGAHLLKFGVRLVLVELFPIPSYFCVADIQNIPNGAIRCPQFESRAGEGIVRVRGTGILRRLWCSHVLVFGGGDEVAEMTPAAPGPRLVKKSRRIA